MGVAVGVRCVLVGDVWMSVVGMSVILSLVMVSESGVVFEIHYWYLVFVALVVGFGCVYQV